MKREEGPRGRLIWEESDIDYLREHFYEMPSCDIADVLGVSAPSVCVKAKELGLERPKGYRRFSYSGRYISRYAGCNRKFKNFNLGEICR